ncbi:uncharacterized protein LOC111732127 [Pteropus vampyrus]|uniref:Uncharacterized protein LOC111732127 n=1 Tax=Pteropus vampyrus TaxID=132908 RepID=A0A6P6BX27_PTEVA|nr:uncharacterized protein LOC111732127 [Pteropus vampyrus]
MFHMNERNVSFPVIGWNTLCQIRSILGAVCSTMALLIFCCPDLPITESSEAFNYKSGFASVSLQVCAEHPAECNTLRSLVPATPPTSASGSPSGGEEAAECPPAHPAQQDPRIHPEDGSPLLSGLLRDCSAMTTTRYRPTWDLALDPLVSCKLCLGEYPLEQMTTVAQCQCVFCTLVGPCGSKHPCERVSARAFAPCSRQQAELCLTSAGDASPSLGFPVGSLSQPGHPRGLPPQVLRGHRQSAKRSSGSGEGVWPCVRSPFWKEKLRTSLWTRRSHARLCRCRPPSVPSSHASFPWRGAGLEGTRGPRGHI